MIYALLAISAIGHVVFWAALVNRTHGLGIDRRWVNLMTAGCGAMLVGVPLVIAAVLWQHAGGGHVPGGNLAWTVAWGYVWLSAAWSVASAAWRWWLARHPERVGALVANHTTRVDPERRSGRSLTGAGIPTWLSRVPGNQVVELHVHEKRLAIPRVPAGRRELRIAHISDFHMSGRVAKEFFVHMVDQVNALAPDLVAITGDLVERERCLDWLPDTLGRLRAAGGVYFVLGNHDNRVDESRMLAMLADLGLTHLGGKWQQITVSGTPLVLAGNELPWYGPAADLADCPPRDESGLPLRILLAHGPDQIGWAAEHDVDLMLAGHNHGGQVRLPLLGAILAPSLSGTRYSCGAFRRGQTVLHVSRGTGSLFPFRWDCPPEIALLVLCNGA
jgi:predicted MPP superfamily phosphohydrolase